MVSVVRPTVMHHKVSTSAYLLTTEMNRFVNSPISLVQYYTATRNACHRRDTCWISIGLGLGEAASPSLSEIVFSAQIRDQLIGAHGERKLDH